MQSNPSAWRYSQKHIQKHSQKHSQKHNQKHGQKQGLSISKAGIAEERKDAPKKSAFT